MGKRLMVALLVGALVTASCTRQAEPTSTTSTTISPSTSTTTSTTAATTTSSTQPDEPVTPGYLPGTPPPFADFAPISLLTGSVYAGPSLPADLTGVIRPAFLQLTSGQEAALLEQGFVVVPAGYRQFQTAYMGYEVQKVWFVTTDVGYHFLHLAFSKVLRTLEEETLLPVLEGLVRGLVEAARTQAAEFAGTDLEEASARARQLYEATAVLLGLDVGPVGPLAGQEVALAEEATQLTASPTTSFGPCEPLRSLANCVDYSLFKPRGHYTRSDDLERYFRAMSMLGQASFFVHDRDSLRIGALAARVLVANPALSEAWHLVYEPTAFMVGVADDYTPFELADVIADTGGFDGPMDDAQLDSIAAGLRALRPVGIDPENASMRIMGVRFVLDSYIYDQLRFPYVGDPPFGRRYASPLDLAAVFGSDLAFAVQEAAGETDYTNYLTQLAALQQMVADRPSGEWAGTVYDAWLYALEPVLVSHDASFPDFMRTSGWEAKSLQTGLASYAELKHDTILYAKQSFAAEGGYEALEEPPRHWVEPDPVAFARMEAVIGVLQDGLRSRGLASGDGDDLMSDVRALLARLARLAKDELAGRPISASDNTWLDEIGRTLEVLWVKSSDWDEEVAGPSANDTDAAIVADIMRTTSCYLEIGTGDVELIYVLVPNDAGRFQIAQGGVASYYEFWRDAVLGRLTDEEWRALARSADAPLRPSWQGPLFGGEVPVAAASADRGSCP